MSTIAVIAHPSIDDTIAYVVQLHAGQRDKAGVPYIAHPLSVMRRVSPDAWHVAVLHDVIEDRRCLLCGAAEREPQHGDGHPNPHLFDPNVTYGDLAVRGYTPVEIHALHILTRQPEWTYEEYVERIATSGNRLAIEVKLADLQDNLDESRLPSITALDRERLTRYQIARSRLRRAQLEMRQKTTAAAGVEG